MLFLSRWSDEELLSSTQWPSPENPNSELHGGINIPAQLQATYLKRKIFFKKQLS